MTTATSETSRFWVTCKIITICSTIEVDAEGEMEASSQAEAIFKLNPALFAPSAPPQAIFEADSAPIDFDDLL